jgi:hypothetical protein
MFLVFQMLIKLPLAGYVHFLTHVERPASQRFLDGRYSNDLYCSTPITTFPQRLR